MAKKKGKGGKDATRRRQAKRARRAKKQSAARRSEGARRGTPAKAEVIDLGAKRVEKMGDELSRLTQSLASAQDEQVADTVDAYRAWEEAHRGEALRPEEKLAMVRYRFVGPGGFERCHEAERLPEAAFFIGDCDIDERIQRDHDAAEVLMCPAMQAGKCQGIWQAMKTPPCHLLLLETYQALGGGVLDDSVQEVVDDVGAGGPEGRAASFGRAAAVLAHYDD